MSKSSEAVKRWRKKCKQRIVDALGGKCGICGYSKCNGAFDVHHLDPEQKDFKLGGIRANPRNWLLIVEEIRKCILLCKNCHSEYHAGLTELPKELVRFDERYVDYKKFEN